MIKFFISPVEGMYYVNVPATHFEIRLPWQVCISDVEGSPFYEFGVMSLLFPLTDSPQQVYASAYEKILALCAERGWETPQKSDIYGWVPVDFQTLMGNG